MKISNLPPPTEVTPLSILRHYWGYDSFRGIQQDIIQSILDGRDTLGLMPTGGGKSITFQIPSLMLPGVCLVITPLIALMKDQVARLRDLGIKATAVYSGMSRSEVLTALDNCILGDYKFLYISPERLSSPLFQAKLTHMSVSLITVDEAHCISQWGYDFRPSYLTISQLRPLKPSAPILALTATATPAVTEDIQRQLHFSKPCVFRMNFERPNLSYIVREVSSKQSALLQILKESSGSAIVYTRNREQTVEIARLLNRHEITALHYHAGLENADKDMRQQLWHDDMIRVMVCTNAFGMGIDKPDVRLVIHMSMPDCIEAYFQEAGRAGRDGLAAQAIMLKGPHDVATLRRYVDTAFPPKEFIKQVYQNVCYYYELAVGDGSGLRKEFNLREFCQRFHYFPLPLMSALHILEHAGYLKYSDPEDSTSVVKIVIDKSELYRLHSLPPQTEKTLQALMRNYIGLFADLIPIEETLLAQRTGMAPEEIYRSLRTLSMMGVIHYIPFKRIAHITFIQRRVETDEITLSNEVYEHRRMDMAQRVGAMIHYISSRATCRSRLLLEYFGQTDASDCGHCDTCRANGYAPKSTSTLQAEQTAAAIVTLLSDGKPHSFTQLRNLSLPHNSLKQALETLMAEGEVTCHDGMFSLA